MPGHVAMFRPPQMHRADEGHQRRVTWMELFYDLVYVATLVQLGDYLSHHLSLEGFATFALLFVPIWWSWVGTTLYSNRFDSDDIVHRLLVFVQIAFVYLMAISLGEGLGENTARFALAYAGNRFVLSVMYYRAAWHIPQAKSLARRYGMGFGMAGALWAVSAFVPMPWRFAVWTIAIILDFGTPLSSIRQQLMLPPSAAHLPERFGLFTIIVLGEGFLKVITGMSGAVLTIPMIFLDLPSLVIAGSLWWIYFDNVAETEVHIRRFKSQVWIYTHLPFHLSLTGIGVGIFKLVTAGDVNMLPDAYRWLICGSAALAFLTLGVIEWSIADGWTSRTRNELILRLLGAAAALLLAIGGGGNTATVIMALLALIGVVEIAVDLRWRWMSRHSDDAPTTPDGLSVASH